ncbi:STE-3-like pheromone receptor, partial [Clavulina sp. PMI_390]
IVCFLATFFVLIPLPWHWRTRNIPTVASIIWLAQANFFRGVSAIIWRDNVVRHHLVYGDIVLQLQVASLWGLTAAAFCITRHLEFVSSPRYATTGLNDERNRKRFEIFMCWISPWIYCGLHLIVQGHRFDIIENIGPSITTYWSWASLWLFFLPPIMLSLGTSFYAARAFYWFFQRRAQFRDLLSSSGLSHSRYLRLMGLAVAEFLGTVSCNSYVIYVDSKTPLRPWISWQNVHSDFRRVDQYPMALLSSYWYKQYWVVWSFYPYGAFLFFVFFGFGREATLEYKK